MTVINAFNDIPDRPLQDSNNLHGQDYLDNISALQVGIGSRSFKSDESGIWLGAHKWADAPFSVDMNGNLIATLATISGAITAATVDIGGADATSFHVDIDGNLWSGHAAFASAPFKVSSAGALVATSVTITGMGQNFVSTVAWTATDYNTATWAAGTIKTSDGTSYSIAGGNTGNIAATTYLYLDPATSITVLQTTTTATTAAGNGKILIAIVQLTVSGSKCIIDVVGSQGTTIDGDKIITGKIQSQDGNTYFDLENDLLQIADEDNVTIIDAKGLVSAANFVSDAVTGSGNQTTTSTTYEDLTGLTLTFTLARSAKVLFFYTATGLNSRSDDQDDNNTLVRLLLETSQIGSSAALPGREFATGVEGCSGAVITIQEVNSGSHTVKAQCKITEAGGSGVVWKGDNQIGYIVLGK